MVFYPSAIRGSHADILFHHTVEMDQTVALVVSTCGCSWKWGNPTIAMKTWGRWETHCNDPVDLDGFRRFPWICRQTSWIQLAYLEICQSFPEIKSLPRSWHVINLFARRCVGIPPKILVLVADPRHAFTVWWQTLGQQPGFMAGRLAVGHWLKATTGWIFRQGSSQTSPSISTSSHSSVKLRRRQDSRSDQLVLNRVALPIVLQYSILI